MQITGLSRLIANIDLIICDLWGVLHDGQQAHPAAVEALAKARDAGCAVILLSNAPKPVDHVAQQIEGFGIPPGLAHGLVTSGHLARHHIRQHHQGTAVYHLGPRRDRVTVEELPARIVAEPGVADVILATGFIDPGERDLEAHRPLLKQAAEAGLELICANPDRLVHVGDALIPCAGQLGDLYESLGGQVVWAGKPYAFAFERCRELAQEVGALSGLEEPHVLVVGDSMTTDIAGARATGAQSLLISGGIHRDLFSKQSEEAAIEQLEAEYGFRPDRVAHQLSWDEQF